MFDLYYRFINLRHHPTRQQSSALDRRANSQPNFNPRDLSLAKERDRKDSKSWEVKRTKPECCLATQH